jgi:hypothetical protein
MGNVEVLVDIPAGKHLPAPILAGGIFGKETPVAFKKMKHHMEVPLNVFQVLLLMEFLAEHDHGMIVHRVVDGAPIPSRSAPAALSPVFSRSRKRGIRSQRRKPESGAELKLQS